MDEHANRVLAYIAQNADEGIEYKARGGATKYCYCNDTSKLTGALWRDLSGSVWRGHTICVRTRSLVVENEYETIPYQPIHERKRQTCIASQMQVKVTMCDVTDLLPRKRLGRPPVHDRPQ
eukprot:1751978-Pleurochrysis_carterae.AAC.1